MTDAKWAALAELGPTWGIERDENGILTGDALDRAFGRCAPRLLDIGVGTGEASQAWAAAHPDHDLLALEVHRPGLAQLLQRLDADGPGNLRVLEADATRVLDDLVGPLPDDGEPGRGVATGFTAVRVLFPDPWPKVRHVGRRLVDPRFVGQVATLLPPGGTLHVATDSEDYAAKVREVVGAERRFVLDSAAPRPPRPVTTYEQRGIDAGRLVTDLVATRR